MTAYSCRVCDANQRRVCANAGLITIDLAESNDAHREKVRAKLDEPYRTMLGHFRHEIGNYYEGLLVEGELLTEANRRERSP